MSFWRIGPLSLAVIVPLFPPNPLIRVRILKSFSEMTIRGTDLRVNGRSTHSRELTVRCGARSIEWPQNYEQLAVESHGGTFLIGQTAYRGKLIVHWRSPYQCDAVNHLPIESYLKGVVNSEFNSQWPKESVDAQVIAARSYALTSMRKNNRHFDLDHDVTDQVYSGLSREDQKASLSVERTRGRVMGYLKDRSWHPLRAFYHSTCGGKTNLPEEVWGQKAAGYQKRVHCPFCRSSPRWSWSTEVSRSELARLLQKPITRISRGIDAIQSIKTVMLRGLLKPSRMRSTKVEKLEQLKAFPGDADARWKIQGRGNGHGVGLCQWGAKVMAEKGYTAQDILNKYYVGSVIKKLW